MATATLTFDLSDSEDRMEHLRCINSTNMASAIWDIVYNSKKSIMNDIEFRMDKGEEINQFQSVQMVFDMIHEILSDNNVNIEEYIN